MIWIPTAKQMPQPHVGVLLYRKPDLYPVVGSYFGDCIGCKSGECQKKHPDGHCGHWTLEEGGPEDGEHRGYPFLAYEPTHWAKLPEVPHD